MPKTYSRPLVIGASGQLGHDLVRIFSDTGVVGLTHDDISIENRASVSAALVAHAPDIVINTAAFHNVPLCETQQTMALRVNAMGVALVAQECAKREIPFATISTDYVFDGQKGTPYTEDDEAHPLSVYGNSKFAGELLTAGMIPQHYVIRTSGLFGRLGSKTKGYTFIENVLQQAARGEEVKVVTDMTFSPSYTGHVAAAIRQVVQRGEYGTYHLTNTGFCTWYEFASEALQQAGFKPEITPILSTDWPSIVRRPLNSSLNHLRFTSQHLGVLPSWQAGISAYLRERTV